MIDAWGSAARAAAVASASERPLRRVSPGPWPAVAGSGWVAEAEPTEGPLDAEAMPAAPSPTPARREPATSIDRNLLEWGVISGPRLGVRRGPPHVSQCGEAP